MAIAIATGEDFGASVFECAFNSCPLAFMNSFDGDLVFWPAAATATSEGIVTVAGYSVTTVGQGSRRSGGSSGRYEGVEVPVRELRGGYDKWGSVLSEGEGEGARSQ
ncbi:hypothetical protein P171DRAFT_448691 [Karstenula rhodostoma CBS 690.94]|uniref:Uncharacterized protein n=1 Tax=Karstenula rhodostoma CBS 690.94 TaxID=1392251 RepID=A0A9P4P9W3_9PLEO|nr:hypothetical protein P171DRAFT_448691 [Karstenula rhodostoma CBS 690.94]